MKIRCPSCHNSYESDYDVCPFCGTERSSYPVEYASNSVSEVALKTILHQRYRVVSKLWEDAYSVLYLGEDLAKEYLSGVLIREYFPASYCSRLASGEIHIDDRNAYNIFQTGKKRFVDDGKLQKGFHLPGLVKVLDVFEQNQTAYLILEDDNSISLQQHLEDKGAVSLEECMATMLPVMDTLKLLHEEGVLHLNVNPYNIRLFSEGEVRLMDLGRYALAFSRYGDSLQKEVEAYQAPECRLQGEIFTETSDVYSVCAVMSRMLTGTLPHASQNLKKAANHLKIKPDEERKLNVIMNGMDPDPVNRTPDMNTMMQQLVSIRPVAENRRTRAGHEIPLGKKAGGRKTNQSVSRPNKTVAKKKNVIPFLVAGVAVIFIAGLAFGMVRHMTSKTSTPELYNIEPGEKQKETKGSGIIPNLISSTYQEAGDILKNLDSGLELKLENATLTKNDKEYDKIVAQSPKAGEEITASKELKRNVKVIVMSEGITLEDVIGQDTFKGMTLSEETEKKLKDKFNYESEEVDSNYIKGYIDGIEAAPVQKTDKDSGEIDQNQAFNVTYKEIETDKEYPQHCKLKVKVSKEKEIKGKGEKVKGLNLIGNDLSDVLKEAEKNDFFIGVGKKDEYNYTVTKGNVSSLKSLEGKGFKENEIKKGDEVVLVLSKGPKGVYKTESDLENEAGRRSHTEVEAELKDKNITVSSYDQYDDNVAKGCVIHVEPICNHDQEGLDKEAQSYALHEGDKVRIYYSKGSKPKPKPEPKDNGGGKKKKKKKKKVPDVFKKGK